MSVMKGSAGGGGGGSGTVVCCGYLKKLKTLKRKWFVLRADSPECSARLEYYDQQRKYTAGQPPKRSISLRNCFNINKKSDTKYKYVVGLYTKDEVFGVCFDTEPEMDTWLRHLLRLQHGEEVYDGDVPRPTLKKRSDKTPGQISEKNSTQMNQNKEHSWEVHVLNRGLGHEEVIGRYSLCLSDKTLTFWRLPDLDVVKNSDPPIDPNVPLPDEDPIEMNLNSIRSCGNLGGFFFLEIGRASGLGAGELWMQVVDPNIADNMHSILFYAMSNDNRNRDDGARGRNRSSSATESSKPSGLARKIQGSIPKCHLLTQVSGVASFCHHFFQRGSSKASERRHSISGNREEKSKGFLSYCKLTLYQIILRSRLQRSRSLSGGRERCDSMPSRARTTSEGTHQMWNQAGARSHLNPHRPSSLYGRDISHSPPAGSPVSPPSVSTDSAGSSYSLADENDVCTELDPTLGRYGHSLTPDEAIAEEDCPDSPLYGSNYISMAMHGSDDGYVDMSPRGHHHNNSPTTSMCSVTSGTPSTDMRFAEYPLEKVTSYLSSDVDDARPARAYSVGSKPEGYKKMEVGQPSENLRVRALSVGSKAKKLPGRVLPPHGYHAHPGAKSSSAPLLSNSRGQGSHNSIGPMDDLMEMDFSRSGSINSSGYMDMRPGNNKIINHGYVEMKPGRKPDTSPYVDMSQGSSPAKPSYIQPSIDVVDGSSDYMEMDPRRNNNNNNSDYLTMSFKRPASNYALSPAKGGNYLETQFGSPKTEPVTPDGYVEMSLGRGHQRQSSLDSAQVVNEDYANMSMGKKREKNSKKKESRSQPIAIQNTNVPPKVGASSSSPRYSLLGRKFSTGTPPMHLPLAETTPYSSLPRQRRRESKDSSSSSVTTPSSSSTIFPFSLNSPCSPVKPETKKTESDYTPMDFENHSDYVNFNPKTPVNEDYAIMKPGVGVQVTTSQMAMMRLGGDDASFRPIKDETQTETARSSSSASSEVCSSGSNTIVGSRSESVNSDRVRPASVSSADTLHYASLDLEDGNRSPRTVKGEGQSGAEVTLTYAAIDFVKSEGLKHNNSLGNAKVKH